MFTVFSWVTDHQHSTVNSFTKNITQVALNPRNSAAMQTVHRSNSKVTLNNKCTKDAGKTGTPPLPMCEFFCQKSHSSMNLYKLKQLFINITHAYWEAESSHVHKTSHVFRQFESEAGSFLSQCVFVISNKVALVYLDLWKCGLFVRSKYIDIEFPSHSFPLSNINWGCGLWQVDSTAKQ